MCIAQAADIFGAGIVAGAFFLGTFAVHPAAAKLDPHCHVLLRHEMIRRLSRSLPAFMLLRVPASISALAVCRLVDWRLDAVGCALSVTAIAITAMVNAPLNRRFARWPPDALPRGWERDVQRWNAAHSIRMIAAAAAFVCATLAAS